MAAVVNVSVPVSSTTSHTTKMSSLAVSYSNTLTGWVTACNSTCQCYLVR